MNRLSHQEEINNDFTDWNLPFYFSKTAIFAPPSFPENGAWNEYYLLDDTISQKIKPSSQALRPTESCAFHFAHTEEKSVWGHQ